MKLHLIRGLPGSGKSTVAKTLGGLHLEADQYFVLPSGNYLFNPAEIGAAHAWCQSRVFTAMTLGVQVITVSNTFSQQWEMRLYKQFAEHFGYEVIEQDLFDAGLTDEQLAARNIHGCPEYKIAQMRERWEA